MDLALGGETAWHRRYTETCNAASRKSERGEGEGAHAMQCSYTCKAGSKAGGARLFHAALQPAGKRSRQDLSSQELRVIGLEDKQRWSAWKSRKASQGAQSSMLPCCCCSCSLVLR